MVQDQPAKLTRNIADAMAAETMQRMKLAALVQHPGESGRARESLVTDFLRRLVPTGFGIGTGFVIDSSDGLSRQQDIVIYRLGYHPIFNIGRVDYFPVEAVAAVVEVKTHVTSRNTLLDALANGASVKRLDRTGGGHNYTLNGSLQGPFVSRDNHDHQVFTAVLAIESLSRASTLDAIIEFTAREPRRNWPNIYVAVNDFTTAYLSREPRVNPMLATHIAASSPAGTTLPLVDFSQSLLSFLRVTPLIDFRPSGYMPGNYEISDRRQLPPL